jgi:HEAT repeat protein
MMTAVWPGRGEVMNRNLRNLAILFMPAFFSACAPAGSFNYANAPTEAGRILREKSTWTKDDVPALVRALEEGNDQEQTQAIHALQGIRPRAREAVPHLLKALRDPVWHRQQVGAAAEALQEIVPATAGMLPPTIPVMPQTEAPKIVVKRHTGSPSRPMPTPPSPPPMPPPSPPPEVLTRRLQQSWQDYIAQTSLERVIIDLVTACYPNMDERVSVLAMLLEDPHYSKTRIQCAHELMRLGKSAASALPTILKVIDDSDKQVSGAAMLALSSIYGNTPEIVSGLAELLATDERPSVRSRIAAELGRRGSQALPAVPELLVALKDPDAAVEREAYWALLKIDPSAIPADFIYPEERGHFWAANAWWLLTVGALLELAALVFFAYRFFRSRSDRGGVSEEPHGVILTHLLEVRDRAAAEIFKSRSVFRRKVRFPLSFPAESQSVLDRLTAAKNNPDAHFGPANR